MFEPDATTLDGSADLEQDNSSLEPEQDNSTEGNEPESKEAGTEGAAKEEEQKPYADILAEVSEEFLKEYGDIRDEVDAKRAKSQYNSQKLMHETRRELAELKKAQEEKIEQQKEIEVKQISETVQKNYQALRGNISRDKASDLQQIEALAEQGGNVTWYDGQVYQVTPENKHIFREMITEKYALDATKLESAFEMANKQALTKEQQLVLEKSNTGYQKYLESKKETFDKQPELLDAIGFLRKETAFNEKLVEDFTKLFPAYYEKRLERERKAEKAKLENGQDVNKLTGVSKLPLAGGKTIPKNISSEQALELSKKDPKAFAEYINKL